MDFSSLRGKQWAENAHRPKCVDKPVLKSGPIVNAALQAAAAIAEQRPEAKIALLLADQQGSRRLGRSRPPSGVSEA